MTRIALAGKGGVGKTTLAATLARLAAREGRPVLAIDADSSPNLAAALGIAPAAPAGLPASLVSRRLGGAALVEPLEAVLDRHALLGPDGVRLLVMGAPGHAEEGCLCSAHATVSAVLADAGAGERVTVVDLEASPEHLSRGTARHVDLLLLVAEPYYRALEATRLLARLAAELPIPRVGVLANKVRDDEDEAAVADFCARHDLELVGAIPLESAAADADRAGRPVLDAPGVSRMPQALARLLDAVLTYQRA